MSATTVRTERLAPSSSSWDWLRPEMVTPAPRRDSSPASSRPIPRVAPVIRTCAPASSIGAGPCLRQSLQLGDPPAAPLGEPGLQRRVHREGDRPVVEPVVHRGLDVHHPGDLLLPAQREARELVGLEELTVAEHGAAERLAIEGVLVAVLE